MLRRIISFMAAVWIALSAVADESAAEAERALQRLDGLLERRSEFKAERRMKIDSLKLDLNRPGTVAEDAILKVGDAYNAFNNDSALSFYHRGLQFALANGNDPYADMFRLRLATFLPLAGQNEAALNALSMVDTVAMPSRMKVHYYDAARQMYSYITANKWDTGEHDYWNNRTLAAQNRLLQLLDSTSDFYQLNYGEYLFYTRQYADARSVLQRLVARLPEGSNYYARAYHILADIAKSEGDMNRRVLCLALSAAADVMASTLEVTSLQELGVYLYEHGDIDRSYVYLSAALENAVECNANTRLIAISTSLPIISKAHNDQSASSRSQLKLALMASMVLIMAFSVVLVIMLVQMERRKTLQAHLEGANLTKEVYLNQFLNMCSTYMDKLITFNKTVNRKLASGNADDLLKLTKSGKFIEEQTGEFYHMFDKSFLSIYPSFVESVNALLLPDKQLTTENGDSLNTDLRILAFMRLGLEDANRVAQVLNYSVNTIYAYRNRLRNRAKNRDSFEADIMKIKSI